MLRGASNRPLWLLAFIPVYTHTHTGAHIHTYRLLAWRLALVLTHAHVHSFQTCGWTFTTEALARAVS